MAYLPGEPNKITIEETSFDAPVSESMVQKVGGTINYIIDNAVSQLGDTVSSILTQTQFQALRGNHWVKMAGQSIVGSDLETLTGISTLPDMVSNGAHVEQASADGNIGVYYASQNKDHRHRVNGSTLNLANPTSPILSNARGLVGGDITDASYYDLTLDADPFIENSGSSVARPNSYGFNIFIKINNNPS